MSVQIKGIRLDGEAIKSAFQKIQEKPDRASAYNALGRLFMEEERYSEAAAVYREAIRKIPGELYLKENLARALEKAGDAAGTERAVRELLKLRPDRFYYYERLERLFVAAGQVERAVRMYKGIGPESPHRERALKRFYRLYKSQGEMAKAVKVLETLLGETEGDFSLWKELGRLLFKSARYRDAAGAFRKALSFQAQDTDTLMWLGKSLLDGGDPAGAEKTFKTLASLPKGFYQGNVNLAEIYADREEGAKAKGLFDKVMARYPGNSRVKIGYGQLRLQEGKAEECISLCGEGIAATPSYFVWERIRGLEILARALEAAGRPTEGRLKREMAGALRKGPDGYLPLVELTEKKISDGALEDATALLKDLLKSFPGNSRILVSLAEVRLKEAGGAKGDLRKSLAGEAAGLCRQALASADPKYPRDHLKGHRLLGEAFELLGDQDQAEIHRKAAEGLAPLT